jgi:hypothetical protein
MKHPQQPVGHLDIDRTPSPRKEVIVARGDSDAETLRNAASLATSPELAAYRVIAGAEGKSGLGGVLDTPSLLAELKDQAQAVNRGNLANQEAMLTNQAIALQTLFARLSERAMACTEVASFEANMRMALRAQAQSRAAIEALALIKNPPVVFAKQANIASGPQQVNNGVSPARENEIAPIKLSGETDELPPDAKTSGGSSRTHSTLATVGKVHRATYS